MKWDFFFNIFAFFSPFYHHKATLCLEKAFYIKSSRIFATSY
ncbi:MAG: hypothetical protein RI894_2382 [Bacteroidota bacterium]